jgi:hypothetical protein
MAASHADEIAYRRSDLPAEQRVKDLLSRMTLEEKVEQLSQESARGIPIHGEEVDPASLVKRRVGIGGSIGWRVSGEMVEAEGELESAKLSAYTQDRLRQCEMVCGVTQRAQLMFVRLGDQPPVPLLPGPSGQTPADFGQVDTLRIREPQSPLDLPPEDSVFRRQILVAQEKFLIDRAADVGEQSLPVHQGKVNQRSGRCSTARWPHMSLSTGPFQRFDLTG